MSDDFQKGVASSCFTQKTQILDKAVVEKEENNGPGCFSGGLEYLII